MLNQELIELYTDYCSIAERVNLHHLPFAAWLLFYTQQQKERV